MRALTGFAKEQTFRTLGFEAAVRFGLLPKCIMKRMKQSVTSLLALCCSRELGVAQISAPTVRLLKMHMERSFNDAFWTMER